MQYTRNTVTGASTADLVIILVDARTGVVAQTRRHAAVAALLGVPHLLLAVNKIDLVDFDESVFDRIAAEFDRYAVDLGIGEVTAIPISALHGDNVVARSERIDWYTGPEHSRTSRAGRSGRYRIRRRIALSRPVRDPARDPSNTRITGAMPAG